MLLQSKQCCSAAHWHCSGVNASPRGIQRGKGVGDWPGAFDRSVCISQWCVHPKLDGLKSFFPLLNDLQWSSAVCGPKRNRRRSTIQQGERDRDCNCLEQHRSYPKWKDNDTSMYFSIFIYTFMSLNLYLRLARKTETQSIANTVSG